MRTTAKEKRCEFPAIVFGWATLGIVLIVLRAMLWT